MPARICPADVIRPADVLARDVPPDALCSAIQPRFNLYGMATPAARMVAPEAELRSLGASSVRQLVVPQTGAWPRRQRSSWMSPGGPRGGDVFRKGPRAGSTSLHCGQHGKLSVRVPKVSAAFRRIVPAMRWSSPKISSAGCVVQQSVCGHRPLRASGPSVAPASGLSERPGRLEQGVGDEGPFC